MTIDEQANAGTPDGVDRRSALKKAAIAAGVVAWTAPVVQAVTARPVHAARLTGCTPVITGPTQAFLTGPGCACCIDERFRVRLTAATPSRTSSSGGASRR